MNHKHSYIFGKAACGATRVKLVKSWDKTDCPDCLMTRKKMKNKAPLTIMDEEYIGSLQEKIDYDCEQDMIHELEIRESMDDID